MSQQDGDKAYADAEKKLKGGFLGLSKDPDAAVECFKRACNNYKVAGFCMTPGWVGTKLVCIHLVNGRGHDLE